MKEPKQYKINVDHDRVVESAFIKSAWIIEDETYDKSKKYGFSLPVGTLMLEVKVEDTNFWMNEVKDAGRSGFSVEGLFDLTLTKQPIKASVWKHSFSIEAMAEQTQKFVIPTAGESEDEFIGRCIPVVMAEGNEQEQAIAICYSYWESRFEKTNPKTKTEMKKEFNAKVMLSELTPEEVAMLQEAIAEAAPEVAAEVVEEVVDAVEETVNELMPEEVEETEVEAGKDKDKEIMAQDVTEEAVMAIVAPVIEVMAAQIEELMMQVAELKSMVEPVEAPAEVMVEASAHRKMEFIRSYNYKFNA